jgi:hypothetical protein
VVPLGAVAGSVVGGIALGVAFNPAASLLGAPAAAALFGSPKAGRDRLTWACAVLVVAWLLGDGFRVMGRLRDALDAAAPHGALPPYAPLAAWALAGLALGYVLPAALGVYVGRRVVRGTGWLSAAFVAGIASAALAALAAPASALLARLSGG